MKTHIAALYLLASASLHYCIRQNTYVRCIKQ